MKKMRLKFDVRLFVVTIAVLLQLVTSVALVSWWGILILRQADEISVLNTNAGRVDTPAESKLHGAYRMVRFEGLWFVTVLLISSSLILFLYYRDRKRTHALQAFFASITHELKTPLTSVRLQAESIADFDGDASYLKALVGRLLQDTGRLEAQVERTLELARVEGGGIVYTEALRLKPLVDRIFSSWSETRSSPDGHGVALRCALYDEQILGDVSAVQIVLKNLLENSLRHSKGAQIEVDLDARDLGAEVCLNYSDNGGGVRDREIRLGRIFEKGAESHGAGVGLYLVRVLMEKMGGRARFRSESGRGFVAELYFKKA